MKKSIIIITLIFVFLFVVNAQGNKSPASKAPIEFKQPDGIKLTIFLKGDENVHWAETKDGYTLLSNNEGAYEYAKLDKNKDLINSGKLAHNQDKRTKKELKFLKKIPKGLRFSESQIIKSKK